MENIPTPVSFEIVQKALRLHYEPSLFIQRVSGKRMDLESCYINLAIVKAPGHRRLRNGDGDVSKTVLVHDRAGIGKTTL
ncbi:hypothetical protein BGX21_003531, partial [Mortierella sp. AD011]